VGYSIFALEIAARTWHGDPFRRTLHDLIMSHPQASTQVQKRMLYHQAVQHVMANFNAVELACWDFFDNHEKAVADYDMWCRGMLTAEGARTAPSFDPSQQEPRYLTFTMAFLMMNGAPSERALAQRCNVQEQNLWRRDTFAYILQAVPSIDFADVQSDVIYLIPAQDEFALTPQDLGLPKFHYLRRLA